MDLFQKMRFFPFFIVKYCIYMFYEINLTFPTDKQSINEWQKTIFVALKKNHFRKEENQKTKHLVTCMLYLYLYI